MKYIICIIFSVFFNTIYAQSFWAYTAGSIKEDEALDLCKDNSGNVISVGYFSGLTQFALGVSLNSTSTGIPDAYITKSNSSGNLIWAKKAGGAGVDKAYSVKTDAVGNIYIVGIFYGTATFGSFTLTSVGGSQDGFIAKIDPSGNFIWAKSISGSLTETPNAIAVDNAGNIIVTGQFKGTTDFGGTFLTSIVNPITSLSSMDIFIAKYSAATGSLVWVKQGAAKYDDKGVDLVTDNLNNIYVCGQFSDTIHFSSTYNNGIMNAIFVMKLNSSGTEVWFKKAAGAYANANSIAIDNANNLYLTGDFQSSLVYFSSVISFINGTYNYKAFLMKLDNSGNFIWGKSESSKNFVSSKKVAIDANQDPYIFGEFNCTMTQYSDAFGTGIFNSMGFTDLFITKYNTTGIRQWFKHYGSQGYENANGLVIVAIDIPVMAGGYNKKLCIPSTLGSINLVNTTGGTNLNYNQPNNYCGAPGNYNQYYLLFSKGFSDIFVFKGIDLTRNPLDFFTRTGTGCDLSNKKVCITNDLYTLIPNCPDTITYCKDGMIYCNTNTTYNYTGAAIGPSVSVSWNGSTSLSNFYLNVSSSGYNTVSINSADGCYNSTDSVYVKIFPLPAAPVISDNFGFNVLQPPTTNQIKVCGPTTVTLTAGNVAATTYSWLAGPPYVSKHDTVAVVNTSATYFFEATTSHGCKKYNSVQVVIESPVPAFAPKQIDDTIKVCSGQITKLKICDSISNPLLNYPYSCIPGYTGGGYIISKSPGFALVPVSAWACDLSFNVTTTVSGTYTYAVAYIITNKCTPDTIYFNGKVYLDVKSMPTGTISLSGNPLFCEGDSTLIICNVGGFSNTSTTYTITSPRNDSIYIDVPGYYYFGAVVMDTISRCTKILNTSINVYNPPKPIIIPYPLNPVLCPSDSVKLTVGLAGAPLYQWYGPSGLIPKNSQSIYVNSPGIYYCTITDINGCIYSTNGIEVKAFNTPFIFSYPSNIMCNNEPIHLQVFSQDTSAIFWHAPLFGTGANRVVTTPGVYSCHVTMCGITSTLSITIIGSSPNPTLTSIGTKSLCPYDSLILSGPTGMISYIWQPGYIMSPTLVVKSAGCYSLEIIDGYGCSNTSTAVCVSYDSTLTPPVLLFNDTICPGEIATISAASTSTNSIEWFSYPSGTTSYSVGTIYNTNPLMGETTFLATSVSPSGCNSLGIPVTVHIHTITVSPVLIGDTIRCINDSLIIVGPSLAGATYTWSGPGIGTYTTNTLSIAHTSTVNQGTYTLQIEGIGCTYNPATIDVIIPNPIAPNISLSDSICQFSHFINPISPLVSGCTYSWLGPGGYSSVNDSLIIVSASLSQAGTYTTTSSILGCTSAPSFFNLTVIPKPDKPIILSDSVFCTGDSIHLSSISSFSLNWNGPLGFSSHSNDINIIASDTLQSGMYSLVASNLFCLSDTAFKAIIVKKTPTAPSISGNDSICQFSNYINSIHPIEPNYIYNWVGPSSFSSANDSLIIHSATLSQSGTYTITSNLFGCISTPSTIKLTVIPTPSKPLIVGDSIYCQGDSINLMAISSYSNSLNWFGPLGLNTTGVGINTVAYDTTMAGTYGLFTHNLFCYSDTALKNIVVIPKIKMQVTSDTLACEELPITLISNSSYANYLWSTGSTNASISVNQSGVYWVSSQHSVCKTSDTIKVSFVPCSLFDVNVFTPNGDGSNDIFMFRSSAIKEIHCEIYNRWGQKMGEFDGPNNGWDGKNMNNSTNCADGTYYYIASIKTLDGVLKTWKGFLSLIR